MLKKNKDYIGFTLTEDSFKIATLRILENSMTMLNLVKKNVKGFSDEQIADEFKTAIANISLKNAEAVCVVAPHMATTKNIEIPSLDPAEIKSIIDLQAGRHTPYSREEILMGYINFGVYQRNYSKVLLVIVNREVVKKQINLLDKTGFRLERVVFPPESIGKFYCQTLGIQASEQPIGIIHLGHRSSDFIVVLKGTVISCRSFHLGLAQLSGEEATSVQEQFILELKKSIEAYQNDDIDEMPEKYIITIDHPVVKELHGKLQENLKIKVEVLSYLEHFKIENAALDTLKEEASESFLDVVASVVTAQNCALDLMPDEMKMQQSIEQQGRQIVKLGVFSLLILILFSAIFFVKIYFKGVFLENLTANYDDQHQEVIHLEEISMKTRIVKDFLNSRLVVLDILVVLKDLLPEEIYLESLSVNEKGKIDIRGTSESMSQVFSLVTALEDSDLFKGVKTKSTTAKKQQGKDVAAFEIDFRLENAPDTDAEIIDVIKEEE